MVRECSRLDFRGYRPALLERRYRSRLRLAGASGPDTYVERLERDPDEVDRLGGYLTIKVSRFYRNAPVFQEMLPEALCRLAGRHPDRPLRLWSAGCGRGEEVDSLAIVLAALRSAGPPGGTVIHGTDVDREALATARRGTYPASALSELPGHLVPE